MGLFDWFIDLLADLIVDGLIRVLFYVRCRRQRIYDSTGMRKIPQPCNDQSQIDKERTSDEPIMNTYIKRAAKHETRTGDRAILARGNRLGGGGVPQKREGAAWWRSGRGGEEQGPRQAAFVRCG